MVLNGKGHHGTGWEQYVIVFLIGGPPVKSRGFMKLTPNFTPIKSRGFMKPTSNFTDGKSRGFMTICPLYLGLSEMVEVDNVGL